MPILGQAPSLIAAEKDFDSLLHACGLTAHTKTPLAEMRTITATVAIARSTQVVPELSNLNRQLKLLVDIRNGIVHLGLLEESETVEVLIAYLKASEYLLRAMGKLDSDFWGEMRGLVRTRLSESAEKSVILVAERIATAQLEFDRRYETQDPQTRERLLTTIEAGYRPRKFDEQLVKCPVCSRMALVSGHHDVAWEADWDYSDGQSRIIGAYPAVTFYPGALKCDVCGLRLAGDDELRAAKIGPSWVLADVNPSEFKLPTLGYDDVDLNQTDLAEFGDRASS
jgi:hypothetical protein